MAFCELTYFSRALGKQTGVNIILPEGDDKIGPFPVFYLLHGLSDDHTMWMRRSSIERYVETLPLIVVMPDGGRGFYTDAIDGFAYETAIALELVAFVDKNFSARAERNGRALGGLSMGGYGALKLALRFPDQFCSAVSHSGAVAFGHKPLTEENSWNREWRRVFGLDPVGGPNDIFALAENIDRAKLPALRFDCGVDDFLIEDNRALHQHLDELQIAHEYEEFPGGHEWGYWDRHVQEAIRFHAKNLGIEKPKV